MVPCIVKETIKQEIEQHPQLHPFVQIWSRWRRPRGQTRDFKQSSTIRWMTSQWLYVLAVLDKRFARGQLHFNPRVWSLLDHWHWRDIKPHGCFTLLKSLHHQTYSKQQIKPYDFFLLQGFQLLLSCVVWLSTSKSFSSVHFVSADAGRPAEFNHRWLYTSKRPPYIQALTVSAISVSLNRSQALFFQWHLSLWSGHLAVADGGPLILKTDRHHAVWRRTGWRGVGRGPTQDNTGLYIPLAATWVSKFCQKGFHVLAKFPSSFLHLLPQFQVCGQEELITNFKIHLACEYF